MILPGAYDYQLRQREYLLRIARAITGRLDLPGVLSMVIQYAVDMLAGRAGLIALRREDDTFAFAASYRVDQRLLPHFAPLLSEIPRTTRRVKTTRWLLPRLRHKLSQVDQVVSMGLEQVIALPLIVRDQITGLIYVFRSPGAALFSEVDEEILAGFADQAAIAIENARLFQAITEEKRRLDAVIQGSADGILITDALGRVQTANPALERTTGWSLAEMMGQPYERVLTLTNAQGAEIPLPPPSLQQRTPWSLEGYVKRRNGQRGAFVYVSISPLYDSEGHLTSIVANVVDITRLKEAEEAKSAFLAGTSHELKTPLALIRGYAETLSRTDVNWDQETLHESLDVIKDEADHLTELVNNLLDSARIEAGGLPLHLSQIRLDHLAQRLVTEFQTLDRDHMWTANFPGDFPPVRADPERIRQVLHNLLSNASKYSPKGGLIRVAGWAEENRVGISVSDDGPGIPADQQHLIFERFYRGKGQRTQRAEGAGLGLYMARAIVEQHGGRIWVESMPERGTTFYFILPREQE